MKEKEERQDVSSEVIKAWSNAKWGKKKSDRKAEYTKRREARIDPGKKGRTVWKGCYSNQKKQ